ncbi:T9SS type A sorting domain-containing protein [Flavobacterium sp. SM15]|uniref:T9SS type A sorting domain-containing protein n=1 Tax=Flavobacterium sp. SM15 TaxID=2908005 RepID=UPI001EDBAC1B|nr:T9SS type A sorting domain-containing protein [Flavobacterium sp. SM15]MCG2611228.1 T9SS type A sorting domain-containing protein [Flavobacterium sp. SM15]
MKKFYFKRIQLVFGLLFFSLAGISQNNYSVSQIPHQVYTANASTLNTDDDMNSPVIPLSFGFDFFGNVYDQAVVSTNGAIDFRLDQANLASPWNLANVGALPTANFTIKNAILGCFHDMVNTQGAGQITYSVIGAAPYRKFVIIFNNQPLFSCNTLSSTFQVVLYETFNFIDVQIVNKPTGCTWNGGKAIVGIVNESGLGAVTPPGRNTGDWGAVQEGWRFKRPFDSNIYNYTKCDDDSDGIVAFNLAVAQNDINAANPSSVLFYQTLADAQNNVNPIGGTTYNNSSAFEQSIYAFDNGIIYEVKLRVVDCANDFDLDTVATSSEDLNGDGNLANDDTDNDGIPNFVDNDDDGDIVLTQYEYVFGKGTTAYLDTDNDTVLNYLDDDDDGDGVLTMNEDYNGNFNPSDDDTNTNSIPDYLEQGVALGISSFALENGISIYPNPASDMISIENTTGKAINELSIYSVNGQLIKAFNTAKSVQNLSISDLQTGIYFVKIRLEDKVINTKLIKK